MVYMYHSFLIHLSADGHLGCFHVLAIINRAHFWAYTPRKPDQKETGAPQCSSQVWLLITLFSFCVLSLHTGLMDIGDTLLCPENLGHDQVEELEIRPCYPTWNRSTWLFSPITAGCCILSWRGVGRTSYRWTSLNTWFPFGQEACPNWALERKVTEKPAHGDTIQSPLCPGCAHLVQSEWAPPTWCGARGRTPLMRCCSGLSESLWDFVLYEKMVLPVVLALLGLGGWEKCVVRKPVSVFPSLFWSKLPDVGTVSRGWWGRLGAGQSIGRQRGPTGPETGRGVSLHMTLVLL